MTTTAQAYPLATQRNVILAVLLALAAAAWAVLIWQSQTMDDEDMGLTMGMGAPLFVAIWAAMMVAIMFPTAAPMVLTFARVQANRRAQGRPFVPTWLFTGSYIVLWSATGVLAYLAAAFGDSLAEDSTWLTDNAGRIGGAVIALAGVYQLSPLKSTCLGKCRSPMAFILGSWRDGSAGALRMGLEHAVYCLGCCWLLFAILFPLGMTNVAAMAAITALIFAEKSLPAGGKIAKVAAAALIAYGSVAVLVPEVLPTTM